MTKDNNNKVTDKFLEFIKFSLRCILTILLVWVIVTFVAQRTVVDGSSMEPTYHDGQNLVVSKITWKMEDPERFDVVVFNPNAENKNLYYIKRIIGLPGETVKIDEAGNIYINGGILDENYGKEVIENPGRAISEITLGEDEYFVLGDNRNNSLDSRFDEVGNVNIDQFIGKIIYEF